MASTYSTNLAIELVATGDQSGAWGTTTNTNLGTLIEQAISGYVTQTITDGADTVITIPNGASGAARNMYIEMTGALTATRNLIVPTNRKLYFVYNNTTGGFSVTVKASGMTGIVVPNGKKMLLVSNGTDIFEAVNYFSSPAFGGALAVASGGTGLTATPTNGQLLIGNGAGYTLSTLTAGTGITLTNGAGSITINSSGGTVTSVTASSPLASSGGATPDISLTGTVSVANGGTGAANLSANAVLLGNGTSALQTVAPGTAGNLLTSDGIIWASTPFPTTFPTASAAASMYAYQNFGGF
jgi:hypothetical protein